MTYHVSNQPWGRVEFDDVTGRVLVQEDWRYAWRLAAGVRHPWTYREKVAAHNRIDRSIWGDWSNRFSLQARPKKGSFPAFGTKCPINFDVRWVLRGGHWSVTMFKMPPNATSTSHVSFVDLVGLRIELDTADFLEYSGTNDLGVTRSGIRAIPHEFGHTLFNLDEYKAGHAYIKDSESLMNVGRKIRARHLGLIVHTLNQMVPDLAFSA